MKVPPPLVLFSTVESYLDALDAGTREQDEQSLRSLHANGLPPVASTRSLAVLFGFRPQFVGAMRRRPHRYYNVFEIRKGAKTRRIQAPRVAIKIIQKWFGFYFSRAIELSPSVFGFVPGRSFVDAASRHCSKDWVFSADVSNFFQTTAQSLVIERLIEFGYSEPASQLLADLNCLSGALAQGSPASPVLANVAMQDVDAKLDRMAAEIGGTFTRYADDIVISGKGEPPENLAEKLESILASTPWTLAAHKTHLARRPQRLKVHGLLVHGEKPKLTKGYRRRLRAIRHQLEAGVVAEADLPTALGHLAYAAAIEKAVERDQESSDTGEAEPSG